MSAEAYPGSGLDDGLRYCVRKCWLGQVLLAESAAGVRAILLGSRADGLRNALRHRFPDFRLEEACQDAQFSARVAAVLGYIEVPQGKLSLPLDAAGSVFQQRVWSALREIPCGETASYADIARAIGRPAAARAVAGACAANPLAVAVPCHRVVRADGKLSGYRWGAARKRALLARERELVAH
jgi:AraC family transcriptional regulator of adaptative response/methylated-DNA-[protein]-cysteine methyltransferase